MSLNDLADIGQVIGAIAVVISLMDVAVSSETLQPADSVARYR